MKKIFLKVWNSPTLMTWGNMISSTLKLLILTPLILAKYNINEIAFWYLLLTINTLTIVVDFGFYPTFSRVISYAYNGLAKLDDLDGKHQINADGPNWELMRRIYGTINSTYFAMGGGVVIIVFAATFGSVKEMATTSGEGIIFWNTYVIYIASVFFSFLSKKFDAVIIGTNNIVQINRWDLINNTLNVISSIIIVYYKCSLIILALNQMLFGVILIARDYYLERQICGKKFKGFPFFAFDKHIFKWCWKPIWQSGVLILCSTGITQATGIVYSHVTDAEKLASYLLSLKLISTIAQLSQAPFYSKLPLYSGLRTKNDLDGLANITSKAINKSLFAFVIGVVPLFFFGDFFLNLIHSKAVLIDYQILIVMALVLFLERNHAMHAQIYVTTNKVPFYKTAIITAVLNIGLMIVLLPKIGVWAFPVAQGLSNLILNNWWNVYISLKSMHQKNTYLYKSAFYPLVLLVIMSLIKFFSFKY